jgi:hypothetical protein
MVALSQLWLPILLSAVIVFVASSLIHMVLGYHKSDYKKMSNEEDVRAALRAGGITPGLYHFPYCTHKEMKSEAAVAKFKEGPVGFVTVIPSGAPNMGKFLGLWFVYCILASFFVAYLAAHTVGFMAPYRHVFRIVGTAAFLAYGLGTFINGVWKGQPWSMVFKEMFDGLIYALLTAGTFGWLWPR